MNHLFFSKNDGKVELIIVTIVLLASLLFTGVLFPPKITQTNNSQLVPPPIENQTTEPGKNSMQLQQPLFVRNELPPGEPTPTPKAGQCDYHGIKTATCECPGREQVALQCIDRSLCPTQPFSGLVTGEEYARCGMQFYDKGTEEFSRKSSEPNCQPVCVGKPVIYLYPTEIISVDVVLTIPGEIVESDPLYPEGGWKNVEAHPDGTLYYNNKRYHELYYESSVNSVTAPEHGIILTRERLKESLTDITTRLGLNKFEQSEFLAYWVPKLFALEKPYIFFSVLSPEEKERIDHVEITPKPDTIIEFLAYFKGINQPYPVIPLLLPKNPPQRIGYTAVEWGGTIDFGKDN